MTLYDVLGMPASASHAELRRAYLRGARRSHPDLHVSADPVTRRAADEQMRTLNQAWSVLGDTERRRTYDQGLAGLRLAGAHGAGRATANGYGHPGYAPTGPHRPWTAPGARPPWPAAPRPQQPYAGWATSWPASGAPPRPAPSAAAAANMADWRRFASAGPAPHRAVGARLATLAPALLVAVALALAALGVLMGNSSLLALAGATTVAATLAFLAAPILAMMEARRQPRRRSRRVITIPGFGGRRRRADA